MTRASSRARIGRDGKENAGADGQRQNESEVEAFFGRKRAAVEPWKKRESFSEHAWDGSMPRRHSARIVRQDKDKLPVAVAEEPRPVAPMLQRVVERNVLAHVNVKDVAREMVMKTSKPRTPTQSDASAKTTNSSVGYETEMRCLLSKSSSNQPPHQGKWCDDCAGLGLHIAALLSELERQRTTSEPGHGQKGWKNLVLGDSKGKASSARMMQEIKLLRSTVDFLSKKIEGKERKA